MMKFCKALLTIVAFLLPGLNYAADPIVIKFSYVTAPNTPKGKAAERFKRSVEMDTKGRVKIELYPDGKLYKDDDEMAALQSGAVQMLAPALSKFSPLGVSEFGLFDLPYIFPDKKTLYRVMDGDIGCHGWRHRQTDFCQARGERHVGVGLLGQRLQTNQRK